MGVRSGIQIDKFRKSDISCLCLSLSLSLCVGRLTDCMSEPFCVGTLNSWLSATLNTCCAWVDVQSIVLLSLTVATTTSTTRLLCLLSSGSFVFVARLLLLLLLIATLGLFLLLFGAAIVRLLLLSGSLLLSLRLSLLLLASHHSLHLSCWIHSVSIHLGHHAHWEATLHWESTSLVKSANTIHLGLREGHELGSRHSSILKVSIFS